MNKINLIIGREYWTRVKSKMFLLTTFLAPIALVVVYGILGYLMTRGSDQIKNISIIDNAGLTENIDLEKNNLKFSIETKGLDALLEDYKSGNIDGVIELPTLDSSTSKYDIVYHSDEALAIDEMLSIERLFSKEVRDFKIKAFGIDQERLGLIDTDISIDPQNVKETEKEISSITSTVSSVLGGVVGTLLFVVIFVFGTQVMRGVNEEKINRIVEVIISSVKPFELMLGKVVGIGLVGLTQFAIWAVLITVISIAASAFLGLGTSGMEELANNEVAQEMMADEGMKAQAQNIINELGKINWALIIPLYFFYFIAGYMLYASVFAAVGAAAGDDINEAQSLTTVVMLPLMAAFYVGIAAISAPNSSVSVWASIIPITSPVVMPIRLANNPPLWEIGLSVLLCLLTVLFFIWLAARIYRVGILMYGKKASFKELGKWVFYKG